MNTRMGFWTFWTTPVRLLWNKPLTNGAFIGALSGWAVGKLFFILSVPLWIVSCFVVAILVGVWLRWGSGFAGEAP